MPIILLSASASLSTSVDAETVAEHEIDVLYDLIS